MTNNLAKQLNLKSEHQELLSVSTFAASKSTDLNTYVVKFNIKLKDGTYLSMFANVLPQITGSIQRTPLLQKDIMFLEMLPKERLADNVPCALETTHIDLLIGSIIFGTLLGVTRLCFHLECLCFPLNRATLLLEGIQILFVRVETLVHCWRLQGHVA